jgi:hypothetical protein
MAKLGEIYFGGKEYPQNTPEHFPCGIVFSLNKASIVSQIWESDDKKWQGELKQNYSSIVVRSRESLNYEKIVTYGLEQAHRYLDILAIKNIGIFNIKSPETYHISIYQDNTGNYILRHFSICPFGVFVSAKIEVRDKDGNIKPPPPILEPKWTGAFRYYRLSQDSQNIFEAYRNLFLSLEEILNEISPKYVGEGEVKWLKRALAAISAKVKLSHYVPNLTADPIEYLMKSQYNDTRCRLFHAKFPNALLPYSELNPTDVLAAYDILIRLWQDIAQKYFGVPSGGGVFTYQGFKRLMDRLFSQPLSIYLTEDNSSPLESDTMVSPLGKDIFPFTEVSYLSQTQPGFVSWQGKLSPIDILKDKEIHRIGTKVGDTLLNTDSIDEGITPSGVDVFETYQSMRLTNKSKPKAIF